MQSLLEMCCCSNNKVGGTVDQNDISTIISADWDEEVKEQEVITLKQTVTELEQTVTELEQKIEKLNVKIATPREDQLIYANIAEEYRSYKSLHSRSSEHNKSTINNANAWVANTNASMVMIFNLPTNHYVGGIVTQGTGNKYQNWVKEFKVSCRPFKLSGCPSCSKWEEINNINNNNVFIGNIDKDTEKRNHFDRPRMSKEFKIEIISYNRYPAMRIDLLIRK